MNQIERFDFHGTELVVIPTDEGLFVSVKRVCEALGIDPKTQREKLQRAIWAVGGLLPSTGSDGKTYEMYAVHLDTLPIWLATIDANRVAEHLRERLGVFQKEAARALREHFLRPKADPLADLLSRPQHELLQLAADLARESHRATERAAAAEAEIAILAPKAEVADRIAEGDEVLSLAHAAKNLALGPKALNDALLEGAILFRDARGNLVPYQIHINTGRFVVRQSPYRHPKTGETRYSATTLVTQKGIVWLAERLAPWSSVRPVANLPLFAKGSR